MWKVPLYFLLDYLTHFRGGKAEILQKIPFAFWATEFLRKNSFEISWPLGMHFMQIEYVQRSYRLGSLLKHKWRD